MVHCLKSHGCIAVVPLDKIDERRILSQILRAAGSETSIVRWHSPCAYFGDISFRDPQWDVPISPDIGRMLGKPFSGIGGSAVFRST
jgi:hypothetical protein